MGTALILLAARSDGPNRVATAALMQQILNAAAAIGDYHRVTGNSRQARVVQQGVIERLQAVKVPVEPVTSERSRSPLPNQLDPRPQIGARTTREADHGR